MADNTVTLVGNVTRDPELRYTSGGRGVASFGLAVNRRYQVNGEWQEQTSFFNVVAWGTLGENAAACVTKGTRIVVFGRLEQRSWETQEGEKRTVVEVIADELGPSLRWAQAQVEKTSRTTAEGGATPAPAGGGRAPTRSTATKNRSERRRTLMASKKNRARASKDAAPRKYKKKTSALVTEKVTYVDYKDVDLLSRFMSDRAKIRNRRVSGNDVQQQREVAGAIKIAREMALLPYARRVSTQRTRPPRDGRRDRDGDLAHRDRGRRGDRRRRRWSRRSRATATSGRRTDVKVILRADVDGLGKRGDIVEVAAGYGRNFLLPRSLAFVATDGSVDQAAKMRRARDLRDASDREAAQTVATTLVPKVITISAKAGNEGKLFGSVTTADVVEAVREQTGVALERRQLDSEPLKTVGQHVVTAKLHSDVSFPITVEIVPA